MKKTPMQWFCLFLGVVLFGMEWSTDGFKAAIGFATLFSLGCIVAVSQRK
jgi:hypothetical protein